ncbi:MAG: phosphatidate cytidylyltransferase [Lentihominibacter sp.]
MKTRILSGLIMLPLLVIVILNGWVLYAGSFVISVMAVYEFFRGFRELDIRPSYPIALCSIAALHILGVLRHLAASGGVSGLERFGSEHWIMLWIFGTVLACLLYLFSIEKRKLDDSMVTLTGVFYVGFFCYTIGALALSEVNILVWLVIITAFGTDICAYFAGVTMGKHKLCPKISPKKTWEGAVGGVLGSVILSGIFGFVFAGELLPHCLVIGFLASIVSMFGDLTASIFKRKMGIKDYGNLIPGHGGILDRFDSVLFTGPVIYFYGMLVLS